MALKIESDRREKQKHHTFVMGWIKGAQDTENELVSQRIHTILNQMTNFCLILGTHRKYTELAEGIVGSLRDRGEDKVAFYAMLQNQENFMRRMGHQAYLKLMPMKDEYGKKTRKDAYALLLKNVNGIFGRRIV